MPSKNAIVIPIYQEQLSASELFSIKNAIEVLNKHDIYFVGPERLAVFLRDFSKQFNYPIRSKLFADPYFASIAGYNDLMLSSMFYRAFSEYQCILIAQTDTLVFRDELNFWADKGYSYIGAPLYEGYTKPVYPLQLSWVGNGGFSLRNIKDFLQVLDRPRIFRNKLMEAWPGSWISNTYRFIKDYFSFVFKDVHLNIDVNEDLFWSLFVAPRCSFFKIPDVNAAVSFAFEAHPEYLFELNHNKLPFGCHAWQRYNPGFWEPFLKNNPLYLESIKT